MIAESIHNLVGLEVGANILEGEGLGMIMKWLLFCSMDIIWSTDKELPDCAREPSSMITSHTNTQR